MTASDPTLPSRARHAHHDLLVEHYPLARSVALRVCRHLPPGVDVEDLVSVAVMGLMEACSRFDPSRGVNFRTFAKHRMHGAILDALRAGDWVPRSVRQRVGDVEATRSRLREELGRDPSSSEVAARMEVGVDAVRAATQADTRPMLSLDAPYGAEGESAIGDVLAGVDEPADLALERVELRQLTLEALATLPERERTAIELFYLGGLPLKKVGEALGVSESRACQLCRQGTQRLRKTLDPVVT